MTSIHLVRPVESFQRRFPYIVVLNDRHRVELANGQATTVELDRLASVQAKTAWCGSERLEFAGQGAANVTIDVRGNPFLNRQLGPIATAAFVVAVATNALLSEPWAKWISLGLAAVTLGALVFAITVARNRWIAVSVRDAGRGP